jgi:hypothetical protein
MPPASHASAAKARMAACVTPNGDGIPCPVPGSTYQAILSLRYPASNDQNLIIIGPHCRISAEIDRRALRGR